MPLAVPEMLRINPSDNQDDDSIFWLSSISPWTFSESFNGSGDIAKLDAYITIWYSSTSPPNFGKIQLANPYILHIYTWGNCYTHSKFLITFNIPHNLSENFNLLPLPITEILQECHFDKQNAYGIFWFSSTSQFDISWKFQINTLTDSWDIAATPISNWDKQNQSLVFD